MTHSEASQMLNKIHKNRMFVPTLAERTFLENLSLFLTLEDVPITEGAVEILAKIYIKSQGGKHGDSKLVS